MHGLHGDFGTMSLKDLVVFLGERDVSGMLRLDRDDVRKQLTLQNGAVINASSNLPREYLGQFLINLGYITEDQFNSAYETQLQTRVFMGRILVMIGLVTEEVVATVLSSKFRETLLDAYTWTSGNFHFEPGTPRPPQEGIAVGVPLLQIHRESTFRDQAWDQFRRAFPSKSCTLELVRENLVEEPRPGSLDDKMVQGIQAGQTLEELMLATHASDFFFFQRLFALHTLGAVVVRPPQVPPVTEEVGPPLSSASARRLSADDLIQASSFALSQGQYRTAYAAAAAASLEAPQAGHNELVQTIEKAWHEYLKAEYMGQALVPQALLAPEEIKGLPLSAAERYLLSRIDGTRTIASIVHIAPLREFESLAVFERFISAGWVRLG